ncbi:hypothetical protein DsansV1_C09g0091211 [Dioscorea sansibarensis]
MKRLSEMPGPHACAELLDIVLTLKTTWDHIYIYEASGVSIEGKKREVVEERDQEMMSTLERKEGGKCHKGDEGDGGSSATVSATATTTNITLPDGQVLTLSDFISRFDEAAKRRVEVMKQKLMYMEMQMEAIENEMSKANESFNWK